MSGSSRMGTTTSRSGSEPPAVRPAKARVRMPSRSMAPGSAPPRCGKGLGRALRPLPRSPCSPHSGTANATGQPAVPRKESQGRETPPRAASVHPAARASYLCLSKQSAPWELKYNRCQVQGRRFAAEN
uniref:cDNA FLJ41054 fis, clone STOMA1000189 n=1 Tax=Homo sapiens TaxID=9606 RepID=Q6ZWH7_HUMAN|nr:unnamed protein product [Homo sapiens]